jgi:Tfp pilus assembly protein PilP
VASTALILVTALAGLAAGTPPTRLIAQDTAQASRQATVGEAIYRRERFVYPTDNRRNPFLSLLTVEDAGPQFENLDLLGIIYGGSYGSVATLIDRATDRRYRVRRGDFAGNARVVEIRPDAVVFQVTQFGVTRSETLRIKKEEEEERDPG